MITKYGKGALIRLQYCQLGDEPVKFLIVRRLGRMCRVISNKKTFIPFCHNKDHKLTYLVVEKTLLAAVAQRDPTKRPEASSSRGLSAVMLAMFSLAQRHLQSGK